MAKKRKNRPAPTSDRRKEKDEAYTRGNLLSLAASNLKPIVSFVLYYVVAPAITVYMFRILYALHTNIPVALVKTEVTYQDILAEHSKVAENATARRYTNPVLGYIVPWNRRGYYLAKRFSSKFTHLSPVWYHLKSYGASLVLEGRAYADEGWITELRMAGDALVLPKVDLHASPSQLLKKKRQRDKAIELIIRECRVMGYDGIVLESWSRWAAYGVLQNPDTRKLALQFVKQLGHALHSVRAGRNGEKHLKLIYVIDPPYSEDLEAYDFGPEDLKNLSDAVDGFSLTTYDFSNLHAPGPNAPLYWIRDTLQLLLGTLGDDGPTLAGKIFLGINFYGNDFFISATVGRGGGAITGGEYLYILENYGPVLRWENNIAEHVFLYSDEMERNHTVFFPTLTSISRRLEEARLWGTGISIWDISQGLEYFFDLL